MQFISLIMFKINKKICFFNKMIKTRTLIEQVWHWNCKQYFLQKFKICIFRKSVWEIFCFQRTTFLGPVWIKSKTFQDTFGFEARFSYDILYLMQGFSRSIVVSEHQLYSDSNIQLKSRPYSNSLDLKQGCCCSSLILKQEFWSNIFFLENFVGRFSCHILDLVQDFSRNICF